MSTAGQEGPHMACLETADALQALLSLRPDTCCAMDRHNGSACESSLAAMDHIVREGFRVLTEPGAHADEIGARVQVAGWRRAFALAATLRGCVWLQRGQGVQACRLFDLALLLGGDWDDGELGRVCHPLIAKITEGLGDSESLPCAVLAAEDAASGQCAQGKLVGCKRRRMDLLSHLPFVDEITVAESAVSWLPQATVARFVGRWVPALACVSLRATCPDGLGTKLTGGACSIAAAKEAKRGVKLLGALSDWRALSTWAADMAALRQALALRTVPVEVGLRVWGERAAEGKQQVQCGVNRHSKSGASFSLFPRDCSFMTLFAWRTTAC